MSEDKEYKVLDYIVKTMMGAAILYSVYCIFYSAYKGREETQRQQETRQGKPSELENSTN